MPACFPEQFIARRRGPGGLAVEGQVGRAAQVVFAVVEPFEHPQGERLVRRRPRVARRRHHEFLPGEQRSRTPDRERLQGLHRRPRVDAGADVADRIEHRAVRLHHHARTDVPALVEAGPVEDGQFDRSVGGERMTLGAGGRGHGAILPTAGTAPRRRTRRSTETTHAMKRRDDARDEAPRRRTR
jgi:hypothetical protein